MAAETGLQVDEIGFRELMAEQRRRAKADAAARKHAHADLSAYRELVDAGATEFTGFDELRSQARILGIFVDGKRVPVVAHGVAGGAGEGQRVELVLDRTPLYAESGGRSPMRAPSAEPVPAKLPGPRLPTCRRSPKRFGCTESTWNPGNSSRVTP